MKVKHFNADLTAWEEKDRFVTFRLVKESKVREERFQLDRVR